MLHYSVIMKLIRVQWSNLVLLLATVLTFFVLFSATRVPAAEIFDAMSCSILLRLKPLLSESNSEITHATKRYSGATVEVEGRSYVQEELYLNSFPPYFKGLVHTLQSLSGNGWASAFREVGVFVAIERDGSVVVSNYITSGSSDGISEAVLDANLVNLIGALKEAPVSVQFLHTHPRSPMARTISRQDVRYAEHAVGKIADFNFYSRFEMIALPWELTYLGQIEWVEAAPVGVKNWVRQTMIEKFEPVVLRVKMGPVINATEH